MGTFKELYYLRKMS